MHYIAYGSYNTTGLSGTCPTGFVIPDDPSDNGVLWVESTNCAEACISAMDTTGTWKFNISVFSAILYISLFAVLFLIGTFCAASVIQNKRISAFNEAIILLSLISCCTMLAGVSGGTINSLEEKFCRNNAAPNTQADISDAPYCVMEAVIMSYSSMAQLLAWFAQILSIYLDLIWGQPSTGKLYWQWYWGAIVLVPLFPVLYMLSEGYYGYGTGNLYCFKSKFAPPAIDVWLMTVPAISIMCIGIFLFSCVMYKLARVYQVNSVLEKRQYVSFSLGGGVRSSESGSVLELGTGLGPGLGGIGSMGGGGGQGGALLHAGGGTQALLKVDALGPVPVGTESGSRIVANARSKPRSATVMATNIAVSSGSVNTPLQQPIVDRDRSSEDGDAELVLVAPGGAVRLEVSFAVADTPGADVPPPEIVHRAAETNTNTLFGPNGAERCCCDDHDDNQQQQQQQQYNTSSLSPSSCVRANASSEPTVAITNSTGRVALYTLSESNSRSPNLNTAPSAVGGATAGVCATAGGTHSTGPTKHPMLGAAPAEHSFTETESYEIPDRSASAVFRDVCHGALNTNTSRSTGIITVQGAGSDSSDSGCGGGGSSIVRARMDCARMDNSSDSDIYHAGGSSVSGGRLVLPHLQLSALEEEEVSKSHSHSQAQTQAQISTQMHYAVHRSQKEAGESQTQAQTQTQAQMQTPSHSSQTVAQRFMQWLSSLFGQFNGGRIAPTILPVTAEAMTNPAGSGGSDGGCGTNGDGDGNGNVDGDVDLSSSNVSGTVAVTGGMGMDMGTDTNARTDASLSVGMMACDESVGHSNNDSISFVRRLVAMFPAFASRFFYSAHIQPTDSSGSIHSMTLSAKAAASAFEAYDPVKYAAVYSSLLFVAAMVICMGGYATGRMYFFVTNDHVESVYQSWVECYFDAYYNQYTDAIDAMVITDRGTGTGTTGPGTSRSYETFYYNLTLRESFAERQCGESASVRTSTNLGEIAVIMYYFLSICGQALFVSMVLVRKQDVRIFFSARWWRVVGRIVFLLGAIATEEAGYLFDGVYRYVASLVGSESSVGGSRYSGRVDGNYAQSPVTSEW